MWGQFHAHKMTTKEKVERQYSVLKHFKRKHYYNKKKKTK